MHNPPLLLLCIGKGKLASSGIYDVPRTAADTLSWAMFDSTPDVQITAESLHIPAGCCACPSAAQAASPAQSAMRTSLQKAETARWRRASRRMASPRHTHCNLAFNISEATDCTKTLARNCCSSHELGTETGRYTSEARHGGLVASATQRLPQKTSSTSCCIAPSVMTYAAPIATCSSIRDGPSDDNPICCLLSVHAALLLHQ